MLPKLGRNAGERKPLLKKPLHGPRVSQLISKSLVLDDRLLARIQLEDEVHAQTLRVHRDRAEIVSLLATLDVRQRFYKHHRVLRIDVDLPTRPIQLWYADDGETAINLNTGAKRPIYEINRKEKLGLTSEQVGEYLKFFVAHTRGGGSGTRMLIESADQIVWLPEEFMDEELLRKKQLAIKCIKRLNTTVIPGKPGERAYRAEATLQYGMQLHEAGFVVQADGTVTTKYDNRIVDGLPISSVR